MNRKYLFFDYDGTLTSPDTHLIPESAQQALARLRADGHFVGLATGRLQINALELVEPSGINSLVADGGNSVTIDGELKWMVGMPLDACKAFLHHMDETARPWAIMPENKLVRYTNNPEFIRVMPDFYAATELVPDLRIDDLTCIYKIFIPAQPGEEDGIDFHGVTWARYNPHSIFCEPTDKAVGIRKMMDIFGAPHSDVVVFGDGTNDVAMFQPEWTSVALGNACDELKERADLVTDAVDDDGLLHACQKLGFL